MLPLMIMAIEDENDKAFMTWLYLQYRRLIYSEIRKVVGDGDEAEDLLALVRAWPGLDDRTQYLLTAKYILKKGGKEIAEDLRMPPDNVRMALVRARRKAGAAMAQRV